MKDHNHRKFKTWVIGITLLMTLASCVPGAATGTEQADTVTAPIVVPTATATIQAPSETPAAPTVMLIVAESADLEMAAESQTIVDSLAAAHGLTVTLQGSQLPETLYSTVEVVIGIGPGLDFSGLAAASPETQFIVIGNPTAVPGDNLSVIGDPVVEKQHQAFMAGYLAAVISTDYKVGGLFPSEADLDDMNPFIIGAEFFCGLCKSDYPPYVDYPLTETIASGSGSNAFEGVVETLVSSGIEVLYLQGELVSPEFLMILSEVGIKVVSDSPPDMSRNNWVGTVAPDPVSALPDVWEEMLTGSGGRQVAAPIQLLDNDAGLASEGRLILFYEMAADLEAGLVSIEVVP